MPLRVRVFFLDRLAPLVNDLEHIALEAPNQRGHRVQCMVRAQLREQLMGTVQRLQQLARAALSAIQFRALAGDLGPEQEVLALLGDHLGTSEVLIRCVCVIACDRDCAEDLLHLAVSVSISIRCRV